MTSQFRKGDKVQWRSHGTTVTGTVEEKITGDTETAGRKVRASKDEPQYRVRSDKSGRDAVHKPDALKRAKEAPWPTTTPPGRSFTTPSR